MDLKSLKKLREQEVKVPKSFNCMGYIGQKSHALVFLIKRCRTGMIVRFNRNNGETPPFYVLTESATDFAKAKVMIRDLKIVFPVEDVWLFQLGVLKIDTIKSNYFIPVFMKPSEVYNINVQDSDKPANLVKYEPRGCFKEFDEPKTFDVNKFLNESI